MGAMGILCNAIFVRHGKLIRKGNKTYKHSHVFYCKLANKNKGNKNNKWQFELYLSFLLVIIEYHWQYHKR